ncbi:variant-silencing SET domain-containing protein [Drosophila willistoni]|uniref:variant-silencing SET domain-containing protein n=1 Tax=Drosophila willistoni TaxID=7260 RepID=UPI001F0802C8|nr:variant-silencing SET domain-containing protein [Drosophila willistoni]
MVNMFIYDYSDADDDDDDDDDDDKEDTMSTGSEYTAELEEDFRNAGCIPNNLNDDEKSEFWKKVTEFHKDVNQKLLKRKTFVLRAQPHDGNAIKVNLWNIFKIPMVVICNRTNDLSNLSTTTTTATPTPDNDEPDINSTQITEFDSTTSASSILGQTAENKSMCDNNTEIAHWIDKQVESSEKIANVNERMSRIIETIEKHMHKSCCPYNPVMDRIEMIHDFIDMIMQIRNIESPIARADSSGYMWLDFNNLNARFDYLNEQLSDNQHPYNCCRPKWDENVKNLENSFLSQSDAIKTLTLDEFSNNSLEQLQTEIGEQQKRLKNAENSHILSKSLADECCKNINLGINDAENMINKLKPNDHLGQLDDLFQKLLNNIQNINESMSSLNLLIQNEENALQNMSLVCTRACAKEQYNNELETKVNNLFEYMEILKSNISTLNATIKQTNFMWNDTKGLLLPFHKLKQIKSNNTNIIEKCLKDIEKVSTSFEELYQFYQSNLKIYDNIKIVIENKLVDIDSNYQTFEKFEEQKAADAVHSKELGTLLNQLKNDFQFLIWPDIKKSSEQSKSSLIYIQGINSKHINELATNTGPIDFSRNLDRVNDRIDQIENDINHTKSNNPNVTLESLNNKLNNLENLSTSTENKIMEQIQSLETVLKDVRDKVYKLSEESIICEDDCDWGLLPTAESLSARIEKIKVIFKSQKPTPKTKTKTRIIGNRPKKRKPKKVYVG